MGIKPSFQNNPGVPFHLLALRIPLSPGARHVCPLIVTVCSDAMQLTKPGLCASHRDRDSHGAKAQFSAHRILLNISHF